MFPGDALALLEAVSPQADDAALTEQLAMPVRRNFIVSSYCIDGPLVACKPHAHLALSIVAERSGLFIAEAVGTVLDSGFELYVDGGPILLDNVQRAGRQQEPAG